MTSNSIPQTGPVKITIKKGEGITYALKRLVEQQKMELSDGKITAKEWNATLDKLAEIQQGRQTSGKSSIFSGGTDKTRGGWHNSFAVHDGQEIEFTKEEIEQLYEAMGAKFKPNSTPASAPASAQANSQNNPAEEAPVVQNKNQNRNPKMEKRKDESGKEYTATIDGNGRETKRRYIAEDGSIEKETTIEYDTSGNKTKETDMYGDGTRFVSTYKDGKMQKLTAYSSDGQTVNYSSEYEYDAAGNKTKKTTTQGDGKRTISEYENGLESKTTFYENDGKTVESTQEYEYDSSGKKTKETVSRGDGTTNYVDEYKDEQRSKSTYYENDGKTVKYSIKHEYDSSGNPTRSTLTAKDGTAKSVSEFDKNGKVTKTTDYYYDNGSLYSVYENGNLKLNHIATIDDEGNLRNDEYSYDENGSCTKSSLADALYDKLSSSADKSEIIALLKHVNKENVIKVMRAYFEKTDGEKNINDVLKEYGFSDEEIDKYVLDKLNERGKELGRTDDMDFEDLEKLDYAQAK